MTIHKSTLKLLELDYPSLKVRGFQRAVSALIAVGWRRESRAYPNVLTYCRDLDDTADPRPIDLLDPSIKGENPFRYIPDGYLVDFHTQMLFAFEVEDHHRVSMKKLGQYYDTFYLLLDPIGWGLGLICVDRWGARRAIPYFDYLFADMMGKMPEQSPLAHIADTVSIEHKIAHEACKPEKSWDRKAMSAAADNVRAIEDVTLWSHPSTALAFEDVFKQRASGRLQ